MDESRMIFPPRQFLCHLALHPPRSSHRLGANPSTPGQNRLVLICPWRQLGGQAHLSGEIIELVKSCMRWMFLRSIHPCLRRFWGAERSGLLRGQASNHSSFELLPQKRGKIERRREREATSQQEDEDTVIATLWKDFYFRLCETWSSPV